MPEQGDDEQVEARVRAAVAAGEPAVVADVARVLAALDEARAESAARWEAIGRLAPAAKAQRDRARDALRLLDEVRAAVAAGADLGPLLTRIGSKTS